jgi:hypothetical protein
VKTSLETQFEKMVRGNMRGRMGRGGMKLRPPFIPHVTFDVYLAEHAFPTVKQAPSPNEEAFQAVSAPLHHFSPVF